MATCIVHLSDLHLTTRDDDPRSEPKLFGHLTGMNEAFRKVLRTDAAQKADRILITGDITDSGSQDQWHVFWKAAEEARIKDRLLLVPGNHDVCCLGLRPLLPNTAKRDFARFIAGLELGGSVASRGKYPFAVPIDKTSVIFVVNSNNLGNCSAFSNAVGSLPYFDLECFARLLYKFREYRVKIVALHHSPNIPQPATARRRGYVPMTEFQRLCHQIPEDQRHILRLLCLTHRVRLVVHGHLHQNEDRTVNGIRIIGAPATTQPYIIKGQPCFCFWKYDVAPSPSYRITHQLQTLSTE